jgi:MYXO-CTERM domain-containing protein
MWLLFLPPAAADPFVEWTGLPEDGFGLSYGVSVADVDGDGWTDLVAPYANALWRNDAAAGWTRIEVPGLGVYGQQYGAALGDYDGDRLPDLATEPRGGDALLLRNVGGGAFETLDRDAFPAPPAVQFAETNAWADVDGDGWIDLLVPAYSGASAFYRNLGPDAHGAYAFDEVAADVGIELGSSASLKPEGAQFADVDRDGDVDLYTCSELLRNESTPGAPAFVTDNGGIPGRGFDEGAAFADVDMDGDLDLGVLYNGIYWETDLPGAGFLFWENLGDGTFELMEPTIVDDWDLYGPGGAFGMSFADWDNDGDPDLTVAGRFEVNRWREDGALAFDQIETAASAPYMLPAWFDWDFDGDLDVGRGVYGLEAKFYTNALYDDTAEADRRFVRVRPVADPDCADTELGATVDVRVVGEAPEVRRRAFTASGHGYLNQSEYALAFGLEGVAAPVVDVTVDFANPGDEGVWRVDAHVNPALGGIDATALALPREIRVYRSGAVEIGGKSYPPSTAEGPLLEGERLWAPSIDDVLVPVDTWVGVEVRVPADPDLDRGAAIREVVIDGVLDAPVACGGTAGNVLVWDVTGGALVGGATGPVREGNRRVDVPADVELRNGRTYRVLARVTALRTFPPGESTSWLETTGALEVADACDATAVAAATASGGERSMVVRWRERALGPDGPDTGDTGDSGDSGDSGAEVLDDSGKPPANDTGAPSMGSGPDAESGCACTAAAAPRAWWLLALVLAYRRRR